MKNDFFIKLAKKDEKMTLLKIATLLCFIVHTMMLVNSESIHLVHYYIGEYERASIFYLMDYPMYFLSYFLVYFLLENILIIIYLKFKVNGEIDKFFKLNYILLIITIIVNLRVIFPKIKSYTNFSKIQKIIIIIGVLFSLFSKIYIVEKQKQEYETILKQESDTNNSNENKTSE